MTTAPGEGELCALGLLQPALALAVDARPARGVLVAAELRDDGTVAPLARSLGVPVDHQLRAQLQVPTFDDEDVESTLSRRLQTDGCSYGGWLCSYGEVYKEDGCSDDTCGDCESTYGWDVYSNYYTGSGFDCWSPDMRP